MTIYVAGRRRIQEAQMGDLIMLDARYIEQMKEEDEGEHDIIATYEEWRRVYDQLKLIYEKESTQ